ncbi:MAG: 6-phosphogluconolactonase [Gammaproteobacteria bacterium]|nr:6-phosphogluconolactonase [Gammaproteobacteria bacterium]
MTCSEHFFPNRELLTQALCEQLSARITTAIKLRQKAKLALPGGTTPIPLFEELAKQTLDWPSVTLTLTDERWVPNNHQDSNELLLRQHLLNKVNPHFIPLKTPPASPEAGQPQAEYNLGENCLPLDVCVLGMGNDGHIASLFPTAPEINIATSPLNNQHCIAVNPPNTPQARISLTLNTIMEARELVLLFVGESKQEIYQTALTLSSRNEFLGLPVGFILHQQKVPVHIYWAP